MSAAVTIVCGDNPAGLLLACMMSQRHCVRAWVGDGLKSKLQPLLAHTAKQSSKDATPPRVGFTDGSGKLVSVDVLVGEDAVKHGTERTPSLSVRTMASVEKDEDAQRKQGAGRNSLTVLCPQNDEVTSVCTWALGLGIQAGPVFALLNGFGGETAVRETLQDQKGFDCIVLGCLGVTANITESNKISQDECSVQVLLSCFGAIVLERLSKVQMKYGADRVVAVVEGAGIPLYFRYSKQIKNWQWGDLMWKACDAMMVASDNNIDVNSSQFQEGARLNTQQLSLYQRLEMSYETRKAYASVLNDGLRTLADQRTDHMVNCTSPLIMSPLNAKRLLSIKSNVLFSWLLRWWVFMSSGQDITKLDGFQHIPDVEMCLRQSQWVNTHFLLFAKANGAQVPVMQAVADRLQVLSKKKKTSGGSEDGSSKDASTRVLASARGTPLLVWVVLPILVAIWLAAVQMFCSFVFAALPPGFDSLW